MPKRIGAVGTNGLFLPFRWFHLSRRRMNSSRRAEGMRWMCVLQDVRSMLGIGHSSGAEVPFIVEGYSRYEFDPWSAAIVKHTIDITNPPMLTLFRSFSIFFGRMSNILPLEP